MAGNTLDLDQIITKDNLGCWIANQFVSWDGMRQPRVSEWGKVQKYVYSTNTKQTDNSSLPWKNSTVLPKLCQIRDNLYANYMASLFPKGKWLRWEGGTADSAKLEKRKAIENYMYTVIEQPLVKQALGASVYDYIDYGNCFATPEWYDAQIDQGTSIKTGYVGPIVKRISPIDIVFNPIASSFTQTPKIVRTIMTMGELAAQLESFTGPEFEEETKAAFEYLRQVRETVQSHVGGFSIKEDFFAQSGFGNYSMYLLGGYVEILTFYGDYYDVQANKLYKSHVIHVCDRHKVIGMRPHPSILGTIPIHSMSWRPRQDNLWGMGPLDNLVGMQYRIDHLENLKADVFDLIAAPPLKIKGLVDDFVWGPFARIHVGDDGDVEVLAPDVNALSANLEIQNLMSTMEEMAGSPKEAAGFRTPGEKTMYEVQRLENAANRIFQTKTIQYEQQHLEPLMNDMLELARRKLDGQTVIRVFDDELRATEFMSITQDDLSGVGRLRPIAARNFADKANRVQNITNFYQSGVGADPAVQTHFSSVKLAQMFEELLDIEDYGIVKPYVRLTEQAEAQQLANAGQEEVAMTAGTPAGTSPDDITETPIG